MDLHAERVIAVARLVLALAALASLLRGSESVGGLEQAAPVVAGLFTAYSIGVLGWLLAVTKVRTRAGAALLCADLIWITSIVLAGGTDENPPYIILYLFVLLSTGLRWGMTETLVCSGICSLFSLLLPLALMQIKVDLPFPTYLAPLNRFALNDILLRTVAFLVVGYLIGYLAEREKRIQRGLKELAQKLAGARVDHDLTEVLGAALAGIHDLYGSSSVTLLFYHLGEQQLIRCALPAGETIPNVSEVAHLDIPSWINLNNPLELPASLAQHLGTNHFCWIHFAYQGHLGWLFVVDPQRKNSRDRESLREVADQIGPVLEKMFLLSFRRREQVRQAQKMEAIGRLASGISHDFNNLLGVILGYSDLLLDQLEHSHPHFRKMEEIRKAADRATTLIRQLLAFSRKELLEPRVLDLNEIVRDMDKLLRRLIAEDIELITVLDPSLARVKADPGQIQQVLMNLAVNARDAMPHAGKLTIETSNVELDEAYSRKHRVMPLGPYVILAVSDTGVGMDAETQARIFEPFFTTKESGKGTGLGLATVYGIVKESGGYIWVYSEPGHGTTFKVYLPRVEEAVQVAECGKVRVESSRGGETILLVEDEEALRKLARECLESWGYKVLEARNGAEALALCEEHQGPIHLMMTDLVMPGMSGQELAQCLTQSQPGMKVLYVSGYTDNVIGHQGLLDPEKAFLQKPFSMNVMVNKVREVLSQGREKSLA